MKRLREEEHEGWEASEEVKPKPPAPQPHIFQTSFDELSLMKFDMRNVFLQTKSKQPQTALREIRHFMNRSDVNRQNTLRDLSTEVYGLLMDLVDKWPNREAVACLRIMEKLYLNAQCLVKLLSLLHTKPQFGEHTLEIICSSIEKQGYQDQHEKAKRCRICHQIITQHLFPNFNYHGKYVRYYTVLFGYYLTNAQSRKKIVDDFRDDFAKYLTSQQKMIYRLFEQLLKITQLKELLGQLITKMIQLKVQLEVEFEQNLILNIRDIIQTLEIRPSPEAVMSFLCVKMKSLRKDTRKAALSSLMTYPEIKSSTIKLLIVKDTLQKTVNHCRGIFLQLLQDQFYDIRTLTIKCLRSFSVYYEKSELKQIFFYMVNDDSEQVRIESLKALMTVAEGCSVTTEDLNIMIMCLKDRRVQIRYYVYRLAAKVTILSQAGFLDFVQKLIKTLKQYKEDKIYLYTALKSIGSRCRKFIPSNIPRILEKADLSDPQEPSWKSISYKAKIILISNSFDDNYIEGIKNNANRLPPYFLKHFEYIRDVEPYAFSQPMRKEQLILDMQQFDLTTRLNRLHFLKSHVMLWKRVSEGPSEVFSREAPRSQQTYLKKIFSMGCLQYELDSILHDNLFQIRYEPLLKELMHKMFKVQCLYESTLWQEYVCMTLVASLLYLLLIQLSPLIRNKSKASNISIQLSKIIRNIRNRQVSTALMDKIGSLQPINRNVMVNVADESKFPAMVQDITLFLSTFSAFECIFQTLKQISSMKVISKRITVGIPSKSPIVDNGELIVRVETDGEHMDLNNYYIMVDDVSGHRKFVSILEGDRVDSVEETQTVIYLVAINGKFKKVAGVCAVNMDLCGDTEDTKKLLELFKMQDQQYVELSSLIVP